LFILPDTITLRDPNRYRLKAERTTFQFDIPFKSAKHTYEEKDIKKFIDALNEPSFLIKSISIEAFSSLEGDSVMNARLQQQRAESIVAAIESMQKEKMIKKIETNDGWEIFRKEIKDSPYADLYELSKAEVKAKLKDPSLRKKLEPILAKQRFARVSLDVIYSVVGDNEQPFVLASMKKAIRRFDAGRALRIQRFYIRNLTHGRYDSRELLKIEIPESLPFASLHLNNIFVDTWINQNKQLYPELVEKFEQLDRLAPNNEYVYYNDKLMRIKYSNIPDEESIKNLQMEIKSLYDTEIDKELIDELNLRFQFKVIEMTDTAEFGKPTKLVEKSLKTIKNVFNLEESTWQNTLQLAYIFIKHEDLDFASKVLAPHVKAGVNEELLFTYITLAAHTRDNMFTREFPLAMTLASAMNKDRYCKLFGNPYLSYQILEHPKVKEVYCEVCTR
ncbi:MAG: hypothetical protein IH946_03065, partial [Bacteroidetes bacterium]|nr:hypothetical protein [Bacteroidota bacterium]